LPTRLGRRAGHSYSSWIDTSPYCRGPSLVVLSCAARRDGGTLQAEPQRAARYDDIEARCVTHIITTLASSQVEMALLG